MWKAEFGELQETLGGTYRAHKTLRAARHRTAARQEIELWVTLRMRRDGDKDTPNRLDYCDAVLVTR